MAELRIAVGRFVLQLGGEHGTIATPAAAPERETREALAKGFRLERSARSAEAAAGTLDEATSALERATDMIETIGRGLTLDPKTLADQAEVLAGLVERADSDGRYEDHLKLARALILLLALIGRWVDLVRTLQRAGDAAAAVDELADWAWAQHELGTFGLAAEVAESVRHLEQALAARQDLGDMDGAAATFHNLELARLAAPPGPASRLGQLVRNHVVATSALVVLALAGVTGAIMAFGGGPKEAVAEATTTTPETTTPPPTTTAEPPTDDDTTPPQVTSLSVPEFARETVRVSAEASDDAEVSAVNFSAGDDSFESTAPYGFEWATTELSDGTYTVTAVAVDTSGNQSAPRTSETVVDNTAPVLVVEPRPDEITSERVIEGTVDDGSGAGVETVTIEFRPASAEEWTFWTDAAVTEAEGPDTFAATVTADPLADDGETEYVIRVSAVDRAGHRSETEWAFDDNSVD